MILLAGIVVALGAFMFGYSVSPQPNVPTVVGAFVMVLGLLALLVSY